MIAGYTSFHVWLAFGCGLFVCTFIGLLGFSLCHTASNTQEWPNTCPTCGSIEGNYEHYYEEGFHEERIL